MSELYSTSSVKAEEKLLRHLFMSEYLPPPKEWYIQLYSSEPKDNQTFIDELDRYKRVSQPIKVHNWNLINSSVTPLTTVRPGIQNAGLILFPLLLENQTIKVKYMGLWAGHPENPNSYLFYYQVYEDELILTSDRQYYISPGELIIYYGC